MLDENVDVVDEQEEEKFEHDIPVEEGAEVNEKLLKESLEEIGQSVQEEDEPVEEVKEEEAVELPDHFKNKTPQELVQIIQENNKEISRQRNKANQYENKLTDVLANDKPIVKEPEQDQFAQYNKEDITAIRNLVVKEIETKEKHKAELIKQEQERNIEEIKRENDNFFDAVIAVSPEIENDLKNALVKEAQSKGLESTYNRKDWVRTFIKDFKNKGNGKSNDGLIKRKAKAQTAGSTGFTGSSTGLKSATEIGNMNSSEFLEYQKVIGSPLPVAQ